VGIARGRLAIGLTVLWALLLLLGSPALAHTSLLSSTPVDGAQLDAAPAAVELVFSEPVNPELVTVVVSTAAGTARQSGAPLVSDAVVSQPVVPLTESGEYVVAYRVVSADGHPVTGQVRFALALPTPAPTPTAPPSVTAQPTSTPIAARAQPRSSEDSAGSSAWTYAAIGLPVAALLFAVGMAVVRSRARSTARSRGGTAGHGR
jgi:copper resistance protein C